MPERASEQTGYFRPFGPEQAVSDRHTPHNRLIRKRDLHATCLLLELVAFAGDHQQVFGASGAYRELDGARPIDLSSHIGMTREPFGDLGHDRQWVFVPRIVGSEDHSIG